MFRIIVVSAYQVGGNKALILFMALMLGFPSFAPVSMGVFVDAQETTPNQKASLPNPYDFIVKGVKQNNYLLSLLELQARETEYLASPMKEIYLDYMSYITSYIGDHEAAYKYEERLLESLAPRNKLRESYAKDISSSPIDSYQPHNALEAISSIAGSQQVIMINEEHRTPLHRAFTLRLLPMLYAKGFRYFAAETLNESDTALNKRGYPTQQTGSYTADPVFGDVIRTALKIGYKLVPYEYIFPTRCIPEPDNPMSCDDERERGQAQNLVDRILKRSAK